MFNITDELRNLVKELNNQSIEYAICGGLAVAIHGLVRATRDIDLLVPLEYLERVKEIARAKGFILEALPMSFDGGKMEVRRLTKIEKGQPDLLSLDLLLVTPILKDVWEDRCQAIWENIPIWLASRRGLIKMKRMRSSGVDLEDIKALQEMENES